jgi:hypothetical protein
LAATVTLIHTHRTFMPFTDYARDKILNAIFAGAADGVPVDQYWAGFTVAPGATGGGTEAAYTPYARVTFLAGQSHWPAAVSSGGNTTIQNAAAITWPQMTSGTNATWNSFGFYDASALGTGNLWVYGLIPSGQQPNVAPNGAPSISINGFTFNIAEASSGANGGFTDYAHQAILNRVFARVAYPITSLNLAAFTANPNHAGGGTESSRPGYARVNIPQNLTNWPNASGSVTTSIANAIAQAFAQLGGSGNETWTGWGIYDSGTLGSGNLWVWAPLAPANQLVVGAGSIPQWPIGSIVQQLIGVS